MSTSGVTLIPVIALVGVLAAPPAMLSSSPTLPARRLVRERSPARPRPSPTPRPRRGARPPAWPSGARAARGRAPRCWRACRCTTRWNALNAATAGMAMRMPMAVATSASEMRAMTASGASCVDARRGGHLHLAELVERRDDADDGPEQPDERRVVSQRAEEGEALLELDPLQRARAVHGLLRCLDAAVGLDEARDDDRRLGARDASSRRRAPSRSPPRSSRPRSRISPSMSSRSDQ